MYTREREELEARMQILRSTVTEQATQLAQARAELERANAKLEAVARDNLELTSGSLGIDPDVYRLAQEVVKSHNVRLAWEREARELLNELSNYADATGAEVCIRVDEFLKSGLPEKL